MFDVETTLKCDNCGFGESSYGESLRDCLNRKALEKKLEDKGWIKIRRKYNICPFCVRRYGKNNMYKKFGGDANRV